MDSAVDREFYVSVELYVPPKAAATLRKPPSAKKSGEKREAVRVVTSCTDVPSKKVKEKSSWLSLARGSAGAGQWRPARCKLVEEEEGCLLNIYVDETILYRSIYLYLLNHTDIRPVHRSLFDRRNCLGIFAVAGQMQGAVPTAEPLYVQFEDEDIANTWLVLMRSYAMPEVYGRWLSQDDGGLYRMWRSVDLTCIQGRNLGISRPVSEDASPSGEQDAGKVDGGDAIDMDVYCEVFVNGTLSGRTTVKKGIGSPDWHERFVFSDLPPFENMEIVVWREKRLTKSTLIGSVTIVLVNFRRGEAVEGWFPVLYGGHFSSSQAGEMRLKLRVDEEIILPYQSYAKLLKTLHARNYLDWMRELELRLKTKNVNHNILSIAIAKNVLLENITEMADREVDGTLTSHNTLFRGNTVFTKTVELYMSWYGLPFLEASVGPVIRRLCAEKVAIEVDPVRSSKGVKGIEKNVELLVYWCQEFWDSIYAARSQCPPEMRKLFEHIRRLVEGRYRVTEDNNRDLPWQGVSAFCFLRFIVPAILHPHFFGLWPGLPDVAVQRSLTLIAKVVQSLANLNPTVQKEEFMRGVKDFLTNSLQSMIDYIMVVSTPDAGKPNPTSPPTSDRHERLRIMHALRQRGSDTAVLYREAIPILPHLVDIPRHLAVVTSVVVRYSRTQNYQPASAHHASAEDRYFAELSSRCMEVEEQALFRVSKLAAKPRRQHSEPAINFPRTAAANVPLPPSPATPPSPSGPSPRRERDPSQTRQRTRSRKTSRPSTAPSSSEPSLVPSPRPELPAGSGPSSYTYAPRESRSPSRAERASVDAPESPLGGSEDRPPRRFRPSFSHQSRSTSTDSALDRRIVSSTPLSPTGSSVDLSDESGRRRKNIFRTMLTRR